MRGWQRGCSLPQGACLVYGQTEKQLILANANQGRLQTEPDRNFYYSQPQSYRLLLFWSEMQCSAPSVFSSYVRAFICVICCIIGALNPKMHNDNKKKKQSKVNVKIYGKNISRCTEISAKVQDAAAFCCFL